MNKMFCPYCGKRLLEGCECERLAAEEREAFIEEYESRPNVMDGWAQQDAIDMYRMER